MKNMIQQMVQRRLPGCQDGPGSVWAACQLQVLHAPHSGASDAENALKLQARRAKKTKHNESFGWPNETSAVNGVSECSIRIE